MRRGAIVWLPIVLVKRGHRLRPATTPLVLHINGTTVQRAVAGDHRVGERLAAIVGASNVVEGLP